MINCINKILKQNENTNFSINCVDFTNRFY